MPPVPVSRPKRPARSCSPSIYGCPSVLRVHADALPGPQPVEPQHVEPPRRHRNGGRPAASSGSIRRPTPHVVASMPCRPCPRRPHASALASAASCRCVGVRCVGVRCVVPLRRAAALAATWRTRSIWPCPSIKCPSTVCPSTSCPSIGCPSIGCPPRRRIQRRAGLCSPVRDCMLAGRWNTLYAVAHGARVPFSVNRPILMPLQLRPIRHATTCRLAQEISKEHAIRPSVRRPIRRSARPPVGLSARPAGFVLCHQAGGALRGCRRCPSRWLSEVLSESQRGSAGVLPLFCRVLPHSAALLPSLKTRTRPTAATRARGGKGARERPAGAPPPARARQRRRR